MSTTAVDTLAYFPYTPRPHQERAVNLAVKAFSSNTVGLLSADCGIGKTVAVLAGYFASRTKDPSSRLFALTRTHSQSKVFESELEVLRGVDSSLAATTLVSRTHVCPIRHEMESLSSTGFMRACAGMIRTGQCHHYWNLYKKGSSEGSRVTIRDEAHHVINDLLDTGVVTRDRAEERAADIGYCPYEVMRLCAKKSRVIIGPYSYLFQTRVREALLGSMGIQLHDVDLLVDEAHNLSSHVLDVETSKLSNDDLRWLRDNSHLVVRETGITWIKEAIDFLWETMMIHLDSMRKKAERVLDKWDVAPRFIKDGDLDLLHTAGRPGLNDPENASLVETPLDRLIEFLYTAQRAARSDGWHVTIQVKKSWQNESPTKSTLMIQPLNSAGLTAPILRGARSAVLMSGTLRPLDHYARLLGVPTALSEDLSSPYPRGTRLVMIDKRINTRYKLRSPELWREIARRISQILATMPANKSALIAFPSYKMMTEVLSYSIDTGFRESIVETRGAQLEEVETAIRTGPHAMFCVYAGKFSEGIDLVKDGSSMIDLIIGVGIPFSPPTSYQKALQEWYNSKFGLESGYYYAAVVPSIRQVAQLVGRLRRSPRDSGVVVLLDNRFLRHLHIFGDDIVSDVWPYEEVSEITEAITQFNQMREGFEK